LEASKLGSVIYYSEPVDLVVHWAMGLVTMQQQLLLQGQLQQEILRLRAARGRHRVRLPLI